jgi:hypothetical protein
MRARVAAVTVVFAALLAVPPGRDQALAASIDVAAQNPRSSHAGDVGARRRDHVRDRYYLGRPHDYAPAPFFLYLPVIAYWRDQ